MPVVDFLVLSVLKIDLQSLERNYVLFFVVVFCFAFLIVQIQYVIDVDHVIP